MRIASCLAESRSRNEVKAISKCRRVVLYWGEGIRVVVKRKELSRMMVLILSMESMERDVKTGDSSLLNRHPQNEASRCPWAFSEGCQTRRLQTKPDDN